MKKWLKVLLIVLTCLVLLVAAAGVLVGNFFYDIALNVNGDRSAVLDADQNQVGDDDNDDDSFTWDSTEFLSETSYCDIQMQSRDGLNLSACVFENEASNGRWVIVAHGYAADNRQMTWAAAWFYSKGYSVLLPDARGHGKSEGDYIGMGWDDRLDILDWIDRVIADYGARQIVLYGVSMGGATVMMASGEPLPPQVRAVVEDCGYSSVYGEFVYQLDGLFSLPEFPVMQFANIMARIRAGYWLSDADAAAQVAKSVTPTLFIHGDADTFVPFDMVCEVYEAAGCPKQLYVVEGAGHGMSVVVAGDAYWQTIENFLAQYVDES